MSGSPLKAVRFPLIVNVLMIPLGFRFGFDP